MIDELDTADNKNSLGVSARLIKGTKDWLDEVKELFKDIRSLGRWLINQPWLPRALLLSGITFFGVTFYILGARRHDAFGTFGYDLGLYDQGVWLVSRFKNPFLTIRGLDFFGHHTNFILVLLAPFYWLGAGPKFLLFVQLVAQLTGVYGIYLLARDRIPAEKWLWTVFGLAFMLHPTMHWQVWEFFHPDAIAIGPVILAYWAARSKRWRIFYVAFAAALLTKEDVALAMIVLGLVMMYWGERRRGLITALVPLGYYLFVTKIFIPWRIGYDPFYNNFYGALGTNPISVMFHLVLHPSQARSLFFAHDRRHYYEQLWAPFAFLPLLSPSTLLISFPIVAANVLTLGYNYTRDARYHYSPIPVAIAMCASVEAVAKMRTRRAKYFASGLMLACSVAATASWGLLPGAHNYYQGNWPLHVDATRIAIRQRAVEEIPDGQSVSAVYDIVPHLTHRPRVYEYPNPWISGNWGIDNAHPRPHDPNTVDWILVDKGLLKDTDTALLNCLLNSEFETKSDTSGVLVARLVSTPSGLSPCIPPAAIKNHQGQ